jgi:hypothetical protein
MALPCPGVYLASNLPTSGRVWRWNATKQPLRHKNKGCFPLIGMAENNLRRRRHKQADR